MALDDGTKALFCTGLVDLQTNKELAGPEFGLAFLLPYAVSVARHGRYDDALDWLEADALTPEEEKAVSMLSLALLDDGDTVAKAYGGWPDYYQNLLPVLFWQERFDGTSPAHNNQTRGMFMRPVAEDGDPLPRFYLKAEMMDHFEGDAMGYIYNPALAAVRLVRMVVECGLDGNGEPNSPNDGYTYDDE